MNSTNLSLKTTNSESQPFDKLRVNSRAGKVEELTEVIDCDKKELIIPF